jgi:hypothetical protein
VSFRGSGGLTLLRDVSGRWAGLGADTRGALVRLLKIEAARMKAGTGFWRGGAKPVEPLGML